MILRTPETRLTVPAGVPVTLWVPIGAIGFNWHPFRLDYTQWMLLLGVYSLAASATTSKQIDKESQAQLIGYSP